jgi:hypothetical protein
MPDVSDALRNVTGQRDPICHLSPETRSELDGRSYKEAGFKSTYKGPSWSFQLSPWSDLHRVPRTRSWSCRDPEAWGPYRQTAYLLGSPSLVLMESVMEASSLGNSLGTCPKESKSQ